MFFKVYPVREEYTCTFNNPRELTPEGKVYYLIGEKYQYKLICKPEDIDYLELENGHCILHLKTEKNLYALSDEIDWLAELEEFCGLKNYLETDLLKKEIN